MVCKVMKKGVVGAALGAGVLALLFGTAAPSYVKTAFHKARHNVRDAVPIQFEIDRARQQIADLEPAILDNRENLARGEYDVEHLQKEIAATEANLARESKELLALRNSFSTGDFRLAGSVSYSPEEVKIELARRWNHYTQSKQILHEKRETLKAREKAVIAARQQLAQMVAQKQALLTQIEEIEARLKAIEATQSANEFNFDDSALSRVKQTVAELEKRVAVKAKLAESEGRDAEMGLPVVIEPTRDVLKEIDAEFGCCQEGGEATADKSL